MMVCIDKVRCAFFDGLLEEFDNLGGVFGPNPYSGSPSTDAEDFAVADIRAWWRGHGCVRCFLEALNKRPTWQRVCKDTGYNAGLDDDTYVMGNPELIDEIRTAMNKWQDPSTRAPFRYYCAHHVETLMCGCSLHDQFLGDLIGDAGNFGHVGWVFGIPKAWNTPAAGFYQIAGDFMIGEMTVSTGSDSPGMPCGDQAPFLGPPDKILRQQGYLKWKPLWAKDGNYEEAYLVSRELREKGYLADNNCNTAANAVLNAFGAAHVPKNGDGFGGMYMPGNYFNAIGAPAVDLSEFNNRGSGLPDKMESMSVEDETAAAVADDPPLVDAVYLLEPAATVHLTLSCPALQNANAEPEEHGIIDTDDMAEIEAEFGLPVCGSCQRILAASARWMLTMPAKNGRLDFCYGRLQFFQGAGMREFIYERILDVRRKLLSFTPAVIVDYRMPVPGRRAAKGRLEIEFHSKAERDACLEEFEAVRNAP